MIALPFVPGTRPARVFAVGVLAALILVLYSLVLEPWATALSNYRSQIRHAAFVLAKLQQTETASAGSFAQRQQLVDVVDRLLLRTPTQSQSAAHLQQLVLDAIERSGAVLKSVQVLAGQPVAHGDGPALLQSVTVRLQIEADLPDTQALFHSLESGAPLLLLDKIHIRQRGSRSGDEPQPLKVQFDVSGFRPVAS